MKNIIISALLLTLSISVCNANERDLKFLKGCINFDQDNSCQGCQDGFELDASKECIPSLNYCNLHSQEACTIEGCLQQENGKCIKCPFNQIMENDVCKWRCSNFSSSDFNSCNLCSPNSADALSNCQFCFYQSKQCDLCQSGKFEFKKQCFDACPDGSYQDSSSTCRACHPRCKTCSSFDLCDSCADSIATLDNDCACQIGMLFQGECRETCPYTFDQDKVCVSKCNNYQGYYEENREIFVVLQNEDISPSSSGSSVPPQFYCSSVYDSTSQYCIQNLIHLKEFINVSISDEFDDNLQQKIRALKIVFDETPHLCYSFKLFGKETYEVTNTFLVEEYLKPETKQRQTTLIYKIPYDDFYKDSLIETVGKQFQLHLQVFWQQELQEIFDILIDQDVYGVISTSKDYQSSAPAQESVVCTQCSIPVSKLIASKLDLSCPVTAGQVCSQDLITAQINTQIKFTQIVTETAYQQETLLPQSIRLDFTTAANNTNQVLYFNNYQYDNSVKGQISYTISAIGVQSGNLTVTSQIKKVRLLALDSGFEREISEIKYPQMKFYLEIRQSFYEQLKNWMFYGMIIVIIFLIFRKQNKTATTKEENSIRNYEQIPKSVEIQMEE